MMPNTPRPWSITKVVAKALAELRARRGLSQEKLALKADVDRTYVGKVERAHLNPTMNRINLILIAGDMKWIELGAILDKWNDENKERWRCAPSGRRSNDTRCYPE